MRCQGRQKQCGWRWEAPRPLVTRLQDVLMYSRASESLTDFGDKTLLGYLCMTTHSSIACTMSTPGELKR
jgi:hypothetical protein